MGCFWRELIHNYLQLQLSIKGTPLSENQIRKNIVKMQMSIISQDDHRYYLRSSTTEQAKQILKVLLIRELPDLIPEKTINQYV